MWTPMQRWVYNRGEPGPYDPHFNRFTEPTYLGPVTCVFNDVEHEAICEGRSCWLACNRPKGDEYLVMRTQHVFMGAWNYEARDAEQAVAAYRNEDLRGGRICG